MDETGSGGGAGSTHVLMAMLIALLTVLLAACDSQEPPAASSDASYVDRVWRVTESSAVQPGTLYTFLSEGTLVIASEGNTPAFGRWQRDDEGLTMVEDGQPYRIEVLELSPERWRIRSHNPGEPVDITLEPAAQP